MAAAPPPPLFPPPQVLPVLRRQRAEDRLQGHAPAVALHFRARQDRAVAHHRGQRRQAARARPGDQARPLSRPSALRDPLNSARRPPRLKFRTRRVSAAAGVGGGRPPPNRKPTRDSVAMLHRFVVAIGAGCAAALLFAVSAQTSRSGDGARLSRAAADHDRDPWLGPRRGRDRRRRFRSPCSPCVAEPLSGAGCSPLRSPRPRGFWRRSRSRRSRDILRAAEAGRSCHASGRRDRHARGRHRDARRRSRR